MGKWTFSVDAKECGVLFAGAVVLLAFLTHIWSPQVNLIAQTDEVTIYTDMAWHLQFIGSLLFSVPAIFWFSENLKPESREYIRTLPLSIHQVWHVRIARYLAVVYATQGVFVALWMRKLVPALRDFLAQHPGLGEVSQYAEPWAFWARLCIVSTFCILATLVVLTWVKNGALAIAVVGTYALMEYGILGDAMGRWVLLFDPSWRRPFCGLVLPNTRIPIALAILCFGYLTWWHRRAFGFASGGRGGQSEN